MPAGTMLTIARRSGAPNQLLLPSGGAGTCRCLFAHEWQNLFHQRVRRQTMLTAQDRNSAVFDELIRPADPDHGRMNAMGVKMLHYRAAKTVVQNVVFNRGKHFRAASEKLKCSCVHRLDPSGIDQGH